MQALFDLPLSSQPIRAACAVRIWPGVTRNASESLWWVEASRLSSTASHLPLSLSPPPCVWSLWKRDMGLKHLAAVSQREQGWGRGCKGAVLAECWQTSHRGPITFPACQEGVNPRGGGQTLGSMVTECVINAAMCPVPRTFSTLGPFLRLWSRGKGQKEERGHPGPPYATASVQRGDRVSAGASGEWPLSAMKLWETTD